MNRPRRKRPGPCPSRRGARAWPGSRRPATVSQKLGGLRMQPRHQHGVGRRGAGLEQGRRKVGEQDWRRTRLAADGGDRVGAEPQTQPVDRPPQRPRPAMRTASATVLVETRNQRRYLRRPLKPKLKPRARLETETPKPPRGPISLFLINQASFVAC